MEHVTRHQEGEQGPREQRSQTGTLGAHLPEPAMAVDEHPVQSHVQRVAENRGDHLDLRVPDPFEELLEGEEEHGEGHAVEDHAVVGDSHVDHLAGLPHVVEQRGDGVEQAGCQQADAEIEHQTALQQLGRAFAVALGVEFADQGRQPEGDAYGGDEEDEEDGAAERYGSQRQRVAAAVAADHQVVGELHQHLPQLGENYR